MCIVDLGEKNFLVEFPNTQHWIQSSPAPGDMEHYKELKKISFLHEPLAVLEFILLAEARKSMKNHDFCNDGGSFVFKCRSIHRFWETVDSML